MIRGVVYIIESSMNAYYMDFALKEARQALHRGDFPVGCVIVQNSRIVSTGSRTGTSLGIKRPSEIDHAEIRALKKIETEDVDFCPDRAVLFSTMEPCLMCFAAIILSGIKHIVYAYEDPMGGGTKCDLKQLPPLYSESDISIVAGVLRKKSLDLFKKFFKKEDNLYWQGSLLEHYTLDQL